MAIQNNNITSYIKDTEVNILRLSRNIQDTWAHATDTGRMFLISNGVLHQWSPDRVTGDRYQYNDSIYIDGPVVTHIDASNAATKFRNNTYTPTQAGGGVNYIEPQAGLVSNFKSVGETPYLEPNVFGTLPAINCMNGGFETEELNVTGDMTMFIVFKYPYKFYKNYNSDLEATAHEGSGNVWDPLNKGYATGRAEIISSSIADGQTYDSDIEWYTSQTIEGTDKVGPNIYLGGGGGPRDADNQSGEIAGNGKSGGYSTPNGIGLFADATTDTDVGWTFDTGFDPYGAFTTAAGADAVIFTARFQYDRQLYKRGDLSAGVVEAKMNGGFRGHSFRHTINAQPRLAGMKIAGPRGHMRVGEVLVINNRMDDTKFNQIGSAMASKWNTTWFGRSV